MNPRPTVSGTAGLCDGVHPARDTVALLGRDDVGRLRRPGSRADIVVREDALDVTTTLFGGTPVD